MDPAAPPPSSTEEVETTQSSSSISPAITKTTSSSKKQTVATTTTVQILGAAAAGQKCLPVRLPAQVVQQQPGKAGGATVPSKVVVNLRPPTSSSSSSPNILGGARKVVTITPKQLYDAQLRAGIVTTTTKTVTGIKLGIMSSSSSSSPATTTTSAKVVHVSSSSLPNIIRSSAAAANVAFIPASKVVPAQSGLVKTVLEVKGSGGEVVEPVPSVVVAAPAALVSSPVSKRKAKSKILDWDSKDIVTTIVVNGQEEKDSAMSDIMDVKDTEQSQPSDLNIEKLLEPLANVGPTESPSELELDSTNVKCLPNEFGAIEVSEHPPGINVEVKVEIREGDDDDIDLVCREDVPLSPKKESPPPPAPKLRADELLCCGGCGRYGMFGDFLDPESCSVECKERIKEKIRERQKRERELLIQKQRREAKRKEKEREREEREAKERVEREERERLERARREQEMLARAVKEEEEEEDDDDEEEEDEDELDDEDDSNSTKMDNEEQCEIVPMNEFNRRYPWYEPARGFSWARYLECTHAKSPSLKLFRDAFPRGAVRKLQVGMKMEAIDPEHPSLICVVSVAELQGARLRLHFDTFSDSYDFWEDVDSPNIFPAGFAQSHGQKLEPPRGFEDNFDWSKYLSKTKSVAALKECFPPKAKLPSTSLWEKGMKLEAVDKSNTSLVCVATVANVMDGRVLVHFDGWEVDYDYWVTPHTSPYIHHVGWCQEHGLELNPPRSYCPTVSPAASSSALTASFSWPSYLALTRSRPVPPHAFKTVKEISSFRRGMKMEVVDKRNPSLVRVATVADVIGRQLKIHFDGWPDEYDLWTEDTSPLLHPPTWCFKTGHPLTPPLTPEEVSHFSSSSSECPTPGCRGIGHAQGSKFGTHTNFEECPYSPRNMNVEGRLPDRLQGMGEMTAATIAATTTAETIVTEMKEENMDESLPYSLGGHSGGEEGDSGLGRGNRRRKRRKFFDEDDGNGGADSCSSHGTPKRFYGFGGESGRFGDARSRNNVRESVFGSRTDPWHRNNGSSSSSFSSPGFNATYLLSKDLIKVGYKRVLSWTPKEVAKLVSYSFPALGEKVASRIVEEEIDGESFLLLTQSDLVGSLGIRLGPALKLYNAILLIKKTAD